MSFRRSGPYGCRHACCAAKWQSAWSWDPWAPKTSRSTVTSSSTSTCATIHIGITHHLLRNPCIFPITRSLKRRDEPLLLWCDKADLRGYLKVRSVQDASQGSGPTLKGRRRPMQICTRRRCPSDTLFMYQSGSTSSTFISLLRRSAVTPCTLVIICPAEKPPCSTAHKDHQADHRGNCCQDC